MPTFKRRMEASLPPTPCSEEMRSRINLIAEQEGKSIAEIIRSAVSLFLSDHDSKSIKFESLPKQEITP